jgi:hypothetical protein
MTGICPKVIHIRPIYQDTKNDNDGFYPDSFSLLPDSKIANLKKIRVATLPVTLQFFACRNVKLASKNYCLELKEDNAHIYTCCDESYNLRYVSIYIEKSNNDNKHLTYLVVFIECSALKANICTIIKELKKTISLLGITDKVIHCSIFSYSNIPQISTHIQNNTKKELENECNDFNYSVSFITKKRNPQILFINESPERVRVIDDSVSS